MTESNLTFSPEHKPQFPEVVEKFLLTSRDELHRELDEAPFSWSTINMAEWLNSAERERIAAWFYNVNQTSFKERVAGFTYAWVTNIYEVTGGLEKYLVIFGNQTYYDGTPITFNADGTLNYGENVSHAADAQVFDNYDLALSVARMLGAAVEGYGGGDNMHDQIEPDTSTETANG